MDIEELFLNGLPDWVELPPKDWEVECSMAKISLTVSLAAFNNNRFDTLGFLSEKFVKSLDVIRRKKGIDTLYLFPSFRMDSRVARNCIVYVFWIEYATKI